MKASNVRDRNLNLRHLGAFIEVARCGSVSAAAEKVFLSQPAITQAVAKLETLFGARLFLRKSAGMFLTEPGALLFDRAERALKNIRQGAQYAARIGGKRKAGGFSQFDRLLTCAQLRALLAVSRAGNFSLAARAIGVSQPSLHRTARDLERLSGLTFFEKTAHGIDLTQAAKALMRHASLAFSELNQGIEEIEAWLGRDAARILVGTLPLARTQVLPEAINNLTRQRPEVRVSVVDGPYGDLLHGLRHGELDLMIGALRNPVPIDDVIQEPLFADELTIAARAKHPLTAKETVTIEDLASYPWVVPRMETPTRTHFDALFVRFGLNPPDRLVEASSLVLIRSLMLDSDRLTLISAHQIQHEVRLGLAQMLTFPLPDTARPIGLTLRRDWRPTATQSFFLDLIRDVGRDVGGSPSP